MLATVVGSIWAIASVCVLGEQPYHTCPGDGNLAAFGYEEGHFFKFLHRSTPYVLGI